jgi:hypothetical protein
VLGIDQQISSFGFIAANNCVAAEKGQVHCLLKNELGPRSCGNASLETMKAFVVKENLHFHSALLRATLNILQPHPGWE